METLGADSPRWGRCQLLFTRSIILRDVELNSYLDLCSFRFDGTGSNVSMFTTVYEKAFVSGQPYCRNGLHGRLSCVPRIREVLLPLLRSASDIHIFFLFLSWFSPVKYVDCSITLVQNASFRTLSQFVRRPRYYISYASLKFVKRIPSTCFVITFKGRLVWLFQHCSLRLIVLLLPNEAPRTIQARETSAIEGRNYYQGI